jgi:hypothetical protein
MARPAANRHRQEPVAVRVGDPVQEVGGHPFLQIELHRDPSNVEGWVEPDGEQTSVSLTPSTVPAPRARRPLIGPTLKAAKAKKKFPIVHRPTEFDAKRKFPPGSGYATRMRFLPSRETHIT